MKITEKKLEKQYACTAGMRVFKRLYPNGFQVTRNNIEAAYKSELAEHMWFLANFFDKPTWKYWSKLDDNTVPGTEAEKLALLAACVYAGWIK